MHQRSSKSLFFINLIIISLAANLMLLCLALFLPFDLPLLCQCIIAILFFAAIYIIWVKKKDEDIIFSMIFAFAVHLLIQATIASFYLGWNAGFQNYCFIVFPSSFLYVYEKDKEKARIHYKLTHIISIFIYILLFLRQHFAAPLKEFAPWHLEIIAQGNAIVIFGIAIVLAGMFNADYRSNNRKLRRYADLDDLTQILNRHAIKVRFDDVYNSYKVRSQNFAICIFDIDDFKSINDTYGHSIGDDVLAQIGRILQSLETDKTVFCRWGGEEFLVLDQYGDYRENFISKINILRNSISELTFSYPEKNISFHVEVTAGIAFSENEVPIHELIDKADNRLYWGKRNGKNQTVFADN